MTLIKLEHGVNHGSLETRHRACQVCGVQLADLVPALTIPLDAKPRHSGRGSRREARRPDKGQGASASGQNLDLPLTASVPR